MTNALTKYSKFKIEMPDDAPPIDVDLDAEVLSFDSLDYLADNYFSEDNLKAMRDRLGGWPILTPEAVILQPVYDPAEDKKNWDLSPKLCLAFKETKTKLVINKTRAQMIETLTGTRDFRVWADRLPPVALEWGDFNKRLQIGLVVEPTYGKHQTSNGGDNGPVNVGDANADLFT